MVKAHSRRIELQKKEQKDQKEKEKEKGSASQSQGLKVQVRRQKFVASVTDNQRARRQAGRQAGRIVGKFWVHQSTTLIVKSGAILRWKTCH